MKKGKKLRQHFIISGKVLKNVPGTPQHLTQDLRKA
jgi:hypothetical protein